MYQITPAYIHKVLLAQVAYSPLQGGEVWKPEIDFFSFWKCRRLFWLEDFIEEFHPVLVFVLVINVAPASFYKNGNIQNYSLLL